MSEEKKPMKYYSNIQEAALAKELGWDKIGGSGAAPCAPGDIKASEWLGECKTHTSEHSIYFDLNVWNKIKNEAQGHNKKPVLFVDNGTQRPQNTWALCFSKNINQMQVVNVDLPFTVRKNITFNDLAARETVSNVGRQFGVGQSDFYKGVVFEYNWDGDDILVMKFETFKELYKK